MTAIVTTERHVDHVSTVPAVAGQPVKLYVREKARADLLRRGDFAGKVALMLHGGYWPCTPAFDLDHPGYSWMAALAEAGWDVFAMDMTGYGRSSRPAPMDDPRNLEPDQQPLLVPGTLAAPAVPPYPFELATSDSEAADIDRVIEFIRDLRGVERIHLIGWSGGGCRSGTYAARHPGKVARLVIYASSNYRRAGPGAPPAQVPAPGAPMSLQTRADFVGKRWGPAATCPGQVAGGIMDVVWRQSIASDPLGASWGPGGLRGPNRTYWGWNAETAAKLTLPVLVIVGANDRLLASNRELFDDLGARPKALLEIACASHFAQWEMQRGLLHRTSRAWLESETVDGLPPGRYHADAAGRLVPS